MPACARREIVAKDQIGVYHCTARCVRRAFLCGKDPVSGRDLEHRKGWVRLRLESLAGFFAMDVVSYAVMSNHLHVILRVRPDVVDPFSDSLTSDPFSDSLTSREVEAKIFSSTT